MGNTQRIWILYVIILSSDFLTAHKGSTHWIMKVDELNQPIYFKNVRKKAK